MCERIIQPSAAYVKHIPVRSPPNAPRSVCVPRKAPPEAAGVVHTDFECGFIRAEIMRLEDLLEAGPEAKLREQSKVALKGRDYVVREGDIVHVLANV